MKMKFWSYGIVQADGTAWMDERCVCEDRGPLDDIVRDLNDELLFAEAMFIAPLRVVRLYYPVKKKRKKS